MSTIRVQQRRMEENTNVGRYHPQHVFPELDAESTAPGRRLVVARTAGVVLLVAGAAVVAAVIIGHNGHTVGNQVAASSKQVPVTNVATSTRPAAKGAKAGATGSLGASAGTGRVSTKAAGSGPGSSGGDGSTAGTSTAADPAVASSPAVNVAVPADFGPLLRRTWEEAKPGGVGIKASDVQSTVVGSVFYAEQPSVHTYWAISQFVPSALAEAKAGTRAGEAVLSQFHEVAAFEKSPGKTWAYVGSFSSGSCPATLPVPVLGTWGLCTVGS
jgi:hypothetical protein